MAALARSSNRPAASTLKSDPVETDPEVGRRPVRPAVDTPPVRPVTPIRPIPAPTPPDWLPSPVVYRVPTSQPPRRWWSRPVHVVAAAAVTLVVTGALGWLGHDRGSRIPPETAVVWVGAGETLWDVAQRVAPNSDPRAVVERIRQLNGIEGSAVQPGQQLRVPDGR